MIDLVRSAVVPVALAIVALAIVFGLIRPALRAAAEAAAAEAAAAAEKDSRGNNLNAVVDGDEALPDVELQKLEPPKPNQKLLNAKALAKENPSAVANIVRDWVNGEAA